METIKISDMRGDGYKGNFLSLQKNRIYYAGSPIENLIKDNSGKSKHYYNIIQYGVNVGTIALTDSDIEKCFDILNPIEFTRVNSDSNGNSRFVCHFLAFMGDNDKFTSLDERYKLALKRARQLGGRKFHNKQYGGGIVFQMNEGQQIEMSNRIKKIVKQAG